VEKDPEKKRSPSRPQNLVAARTCADIVKTIKKKKRIEKKAEGGKKKRGGKRLATGKHRARRGQPAPWDRGMRLARLMGGGSWPLGKKKGGGGEKKKTHTGLN